MRLLIVFILAFTSLAQAATPVGSGDSVAIAGGDGIDLLVWRDASADRVQVMRFSSTGTPLDTAPLDLPFTAGGEPSVAWDGSGFLIAWPASNVAVARIAAGGETSFAMGIPVTAPSRWTTVASIADGSSLVAWSEGERVFATRIASTGELSFPEALPFPLPSQAKLVREGSSYILGWVGTCGTAPCPPGTSALVQRLDENGTSTRPAGSLTFAHSGRSIWSFAGGPRALLTESPDSMPAQTTLLSFDPGEYRAARRTIRFPQPLTAQQTRTGLALIGLGARIDVSETGAPLTVNWAPVAEGRRLIGVLPSSGLRVLAPASGTGAISIETPSTDTSEVGLTPVFASADTVWLKVDNRGPDPARTIDVWVTAPVKSMSSLVSGTITRAGSLSRLRFQPNLEQGAGFEIALYFEQPIDPAAFEAWALALGTDRDATNNYVSTRVEPEPETARRRRTVRR